MGTVTMAKKKAARAKPAAVEPREGRKAIAVVVRGGPDWKAWLEGLAYHCRTDVAKLVDAALVDYLKQRGFDETPPPR